MVLQSYKLGHIRARKATVCWPARKTGYRSLAPSAQRQHRPTSDGSGVDSGQSGSGGQQHGKSAADSHALGPSQGIVVLGLRVRDITAAQQPEYNSRSAVKHLTLALSSETKRFSVYVVTLVCHCADQRACKYSQQ